MVSNRVYYSDIFFLGSSILEFDSKWPIFVHVYLLVRHVLFVLMYVFLALFFLLELFVGICADEVSPQQPVKCPPTSPSVWAVIRPKKGPEYYEAPEKYIKTSYQGMRY